ncbi:ABC transporter substrate-binding protein [Nocardioides sp. R-C-SC26]|uniref:ABC transporter substrate-binding protein n=1 Tax=Nocardioides sp. R-C-SC26 TaxID=2870414 RepID=UPI001E5E13D5|nr:ABC transporter substrate-binding protein [Nocardioides sp. R-C-SC26]
MRSRPLPLFSTTSIRRTGLGIVSLATVLALAGCAGEPEADKTASEPGQSGVADAAYPVTIESCGRSTTLDAPPTRAVTLNQGATEVALALGVADQMAGTAYIDDQVADQWADAYAAVPVLSAEYPTGEEFLAAEPDFAYASYVSAFDREVAGTQDDLEGDGIATYLSPFGCEDKELRPAPSFDAVWDEIDTVGAAFGVPERAAELRTAQEDALAAVADEASGEGVTVLWYDSGTKTPLVGAGDGGPGLVIEATGAENIFADLEGSWADGNWEDVVEADPDVIVLVDAAWDAASAKREHLENDPVLSKLTAVAQGRLITIAYSESTPGVRMVDGARHLAEGIAALDLG